MIDFGWQATSTDEDNAGTVVGVMFDFLTKDLAGVVVRRGAMATRDLVVPVEHVVSYADGVVMLDLSSEGLEGCEDYLIHRYVSPELDMRPPAGADPQGVVLGTTPSVMTGDPMNPWTVGGTPLVEEVASNVVQGAVAFVQGQEVLTTEGVVLGSVSRIVYDDTGLVGIVVRPEQLFGSGKVIPFEAILDGVGDQLAVELDQAAFSQLPEAAVA